MTKKHRRRWSRCIAKPREGGRVGGGGERKRIREREERKGKRRKRKKRCA